MVEPAQPARTAQSIRAAADSGMQPAMMTARERGWIGDFRNQHESFFRSKVLYRSWENAYKMEVSRLYG
jgi:hypothetical protein